MDRAIENVIAAQTELIKSNGYKVTMSRDVLRLDSANKVFFLGDDTVIVDAIIINNSLVDYSRVKLMLLSNNVMYENINQSDLFIGYAGRGVLTAALSEPNVAGIDEIGTVNSNKLPINIHIIRLTPTK